MSDVLDSIRGPSSVLSRYMLPQLTPGLADAPPKPQPNVTTTTGPGLKVTVDRTQAPVGPIRPGAAAIPPQARKAQAAAAAAAPHPVEDPNIQAQLQDPETRQLLAEAMVGEGRTPQQQQEIMELILNRARMSGQSVREVIEEAGQFTSMDYGVKGSRRTKLDAEAAANDPAIQGAMGLIENPHPAWRINPGLTHVINRGLQEQYSKEDPSQYHGMPEWAQGKPGLQTGDLSFYPGSFPHGHQQQAPAAQAQAGGASPEGPGLDPDAMAFVKENLALEKANLPLQLKALEEKQAFNNQVAERLMGFMDKNNEITDRLMRSNQSLIDAMPDEHKLRQEELAKVSDQPMDPTRVLGQLLPIMAIVGGAFTKAGAIGSLNAAAAAMTAAKGNDDAAIKRASDEFHDRLTETMDKWSIVHQAMTEAYTNNKDNMQNYMAAMQLVAAQYEIPGLQQAIYSGNIKDAMSFADTGLKTALQLQRLQINALTAENDQVKLTSALQAAQAGQELTDSDLAELAFAQRKDPNFHPQFSFNRQTQDRYAHIQGMVLKHHDLNTWDDIQKAEGITPADASATSASQDIGTRSETVANQKALDQAVERRGAVEQFEGTAQREADLTLEYAKKRGVAGTSSPILNGWIQAGRKASGDPDVTAFDSVITSFANEYMQVMTTGGTGASGRALTDAARREVTHLLDHTMNMQQLESTIRAMKRSMNNRMASLNSTVEDIQSQISDPGGKPKKGTPSTVTTPAAPAAHNDPLGLR